MPVKGTEVGYHATKINNVESILKNGLRNSSKGRLGGEGIYVNNTLNGAIAEFRHYYPDEAYSVLKVEYNKGLNLIVSPPPLSKSSGLLPFTKGAGT